MALTQANRIATFPGMLDFTTQKTEKSAEVWISGLGMYGIKKGHSGV